MDKELRDRQVDRFILNEMEPEERAAFCRQLEEEPRLREEVSLRMMLVEAEVMAAERKAREAMEGTPALAKANRHSLGIGIACVVAILIAAVFFGASPRYTPQEVYEAHYSIPPIERARGGNGLTGTSQLFNEKIILLYDRFAYREIANAYKENQGERWIGELPVSTLLYIGVSLLEQGDATMAISLLSSCEGSDYQEEIQWVLLGGYLQEGQKAKALQIAREIGEEKGLYAVQAGRIEKDLKEKKWF